MQGFIQLLYQKVKVFVIVWIFILSILQIGSKLKFVISQSITKKMPQLDFTSTKDFL